MVTSLQVHDLIHLDRHSVAVLSDEADCQGHDWVRGSLHRAPLAVVRRQNALEPMKVAIGVRGAIRSHRWGAEIPVSSVDISSTLTPKSLHPRQAAPTQQSLPAFSALAEVHAINTSLDWGPGGSVGFELASGCETSTNFSDLDLVTRIPEGAKLSDFESCLVRFYDCLATIAEQTGTRIDCLVETEVGALSLEEIVGHVTDSASTSVVLRTTEGPQLVSNPWSL